MSSRSGKIKKYGVIGYPLNHSFSPDIHNMAFEYHHINGQYERVEIMPDHFESQIKDLKTENWLGFNVTIPFKERIFKYLDWIDPICEKIRAVNTIKVTSDGRWDGYNTDYLGFLNPIKNSLNKISSCLVIGAGGSSRAVCFGLLSKSSLNELAIINRTVERAEQLVGDLDATSIITFNIYSFDDLSKVNKKFDLIVNTTSIGMGKLAGKIPLNPAAYSEQDTMIYDLVYNPLKTEFLKIAESNGLSCFNGLQMLVSQAEESFRIWTGLDFQGGLRDLIHNNLVRKFE